MSNEARFRILEKLTIPQSAALAVGALYVTGYYINSIFMRNYGVSDSELLKLEYIKIGFVFALLTLGFVFLPGGVFFLTYRVRKASKLPHYHIGAIGNSLNTILFLGIPLLLALFATQYEFDLPLSRPVWGVQSLKGSLIAFLLLSGFGTIFLPGIERLIVANANNKTALQLYRFVVEPVRYGIIFASLLLIISTFGEIPWVPDLLDRGIYYFFAGLVFVVGILSAMLWTKNISNVKGSSVVYALIGIGLCILYYMAITSYVYGVYTLIPCNRGGRLPVTEAYVKVDESLPDIGGSIVIGGRRLRGPVYIIEENASVLYVASENMNNWNSAFVPIHALRKDEIPYIYLTRIEDGFPRVKRMQGFSPINADSVK